MAGPVVAAPVAGVYVAGAALLAGAAWLLTPAGQRASETLGDAIYEGGAQAVDNVKDAVNSVSDIFSDDEVVPTTTTNDTTARCDGPHRGRLQVQGYNRRVDPHLLELSWPWTRSCVPPLRLEGLAAISGVLLPATQAVSFGSAGYRGPAFAKMSQHISKAPPIGFLAGHRIGWAINHATGQAVPNQRAIGGAPRVDLEVIQGRAFGDR